MSTKPAEETPLSQQTVSEVETPPTGKTLSLDDIIIIVESLLFVADHPVTVTELAKAVDVSKSQIEKALKQLSLDYHNRGLRLQRQGVKLQLVTASEMSEYVERFLGLSVSAKLSMAAMEVLGIVAYKQPITRPEIEAVRGVNSDGVLRSLLSKGLVEEVGRLNTVGHPIQYGTTFEFLQYFGLTSLDDMPDLEMNEDLDNLIGDAFQRQSATPINPDTFVQEPLDESLGL
ncbi:MAG: SMC-Scp complex subunit ScpB [Chloroflexota bacterium]